MLFFLKGVVEIFFIFLLMDLDDFYLWFINKRNCYGIGLWVGIVVSNIYRLLENKFILLVYDVFFICVVDLISIFYKIVNIFR